MFSSTSNLTSSLSSWFKDVSDTLQGPSSTNETQEDNNQDSTSKINNDQELKKAEDNTPECSETLSEETATDSTQEPDVPKPEEDEQSLTNLTQSVLNMKPEEVQKKLSEETQKMVSSAMSFGNFLYGVASDATKKVSSQVTIEKLQEIKKTVEEKTMLADLNRTQKEFIQEKREKEGDHAQPPWYGYQEEDKMKAQILALSTDSRNFLRSPPSGVQFQFDFQHSFAIAKATLEQDENLRKMRFNLVPTKVQEEVFWRNYFYRVSLIKQSAQLATLTDLNKSTESPGASSSSSFDVVGSTATGTTLSRSSSSKSVKSLSRLEQENNSTDDVATASHDDDLQDAAEFASDAYDASNLNPDDLEREMRELGMKDDLTEGDAIPEWEKELQKELQDYEVVDEDPKDEFWEEEIQNMLNDEQKQQ